MSQSWGDMSAWTVEECRGRQKFCIVEMEKRRGKSLLCGDCGGLQKRTHYKCGGKIAGESTYRKRGTDVIMEDYLYCLTISLAVKPDCITLTGSIASVPC